MNDYRTEHTNGGQFHLKLRLNFFVIARSPDISRGRRGDLPRLLRPMDIGLAMTFRFMDFTIDLSFLNDLAAMNPLQSTWYIISHGGWVFIVWALLWGAWNYWLFIRHRAWTGKQPYVLLAIDVPKMNEQSPKAAENMFSTFAGMHGTETLWEEYYEGREQLQSSLEIISIDGYVQFLIRCPEKYRDLVEAGIYSQYPDAEITEVEDYTKLVPQHFPHPDWQMWGLEYKLNRHQAYPLRTYVEFEHSLSGEFKDPMAALMEVMSTLRKGEQTWIQYVITPIDDRWQIEVEEEIVPKLIGKKVHEKTSILWYILNIPMTVVGFVLDQFMSPGEGGGHETKKDDPPTMMLHLSPGEKHVLEKIQEKAAKIGFNVKCRILYIAKKEVYHKGRGVMAIMGALKQYNTIDMNRFAVCKKVWTQVYYVFTKWRLAHRQNRLMDAYRFRSNWRGEGYGFVLNIEELASLWHFPVIEVKAPLVKKTESKKAEPPFSLPIVPESSDELEKLLEQATPGPIRKESPQQPAAQEEKTQAPDNLPVA